MCIYIYIYIERERYAAAVNPGLPADEHGERRTASFLLPWCTKHGAHFGDKAILCEYNTWRPLWGQISFLDAHNTTPTLEIILHLEYQFDRIPLAE